MKRKLMLLLLTGMMMVCFIGCGNSGKKEAVESAAEPVVEAEAVDKNPTKPDTNEVAEEVTYITEPAELVCVLPDGFKAAPNEDGLYVHSSYPQDTSTISYVISDGTRDLTEIDMKDYESDIEASFYDTYGDEVDVTVTSYENVVVDGRKGLKIKISYEFKGIGYEQLIYMIYNGTETHIMNYTQEAGKNWMEKFEESGNSIWFKAFEE